jgi:nucleotide-binding universal stress UspA family protein
VASLPFLRGHSLATTIVTVGSSGDRADADGVLAYLRRHGIDARAEAIEPKRSSARARGRALLEHAERNGFDLIVMGAYGDGGLMRFLGLGGATGKVISAAKVPVLLAH